VKVPLLKKTLGVDVDVQVTARPAQIIMAVGLLILCMGIAYSFCKGYSIVKIVETPKTHRALPPALPAAGTADAPYMK
jgi:hypothetical protein